jgi:hypothetical protein
VTTLDMSRWCTWTGSRGRQCYAYCLPGRVVCSKHRREPGLPPVELQARRKLVTSLTPASAVVLIQALIAREDLSSWRRALHVATLEGIVREGFTVSLSGAIATSVATSRAIPSNSWRFGGCAPVAQISEKSAKCLENRGGPNGIRTRV